MTQRWLPIAPSLSWLSSSGLCLSLALTSACATDSSTGNEPAASPEQEPAASPEAPVDAGPATRTPLTLTTSDNISIDAFALDAPAGAPGVLLLHQFQQSHQQWGTFPEALNAAGYFVLAISYRGHGASDAYAPPLTELLNDPAGAPLDVEAALAALIARGADASRIGVVGTSIGANLTVAAAINGDAKTYVSMSSRIPPTENLAGNTANGMRSVFYISSENDGGGQADDARTLHERTADPKDLLITTGGGHGIALLNDFPEVETRTLQWLADTL